MQELVIGIDTSCYTTSVAAVTAAGTVRADVRQVLSVPEGEIGLRQQAALFQHWQNLPVLLGRLRKEARGPIIAVAYSGSPRKEAGSYLPVFTAGANLANSLGAALQVPVYSFSHQEGHLAAGEFGAGGPAGASFLAVHLSGGTTELLKVERWACGYKISVLGKSLDLNAGQFVDRVGVALGLPFPAGRHLEELAVSAGETELSLPSVVRGYDLSFAGPTSAALRLLERGAEKGAVARAVFRSIAKALEKILRPAVLTTGLREILLVGGVASNSLIRERLVERLEHPAVGARLFFAPPHLSTDNAVGIARLGRAILKGEMP
ncbi:MAG: hypothetical protein PWQ41_429 [Bacillota bacterium]|jgi:N6-L-threonylcarbamoyladenine synthase|nr:hypothetical protein [Bacillota bacterium]MDK2924655.1 hypothetical protein [Bacillota bacterium]MDK2960771.1 hypothetical protein [Bacillota bacterium]